MNKRSLLPEVRNIKASLSIDRSNLLLRKKFRTGSHQIYTSGILRGAWTALLSVPLKIHQVWVQAIPSHQAMYFLTSQVIVSFLHWPIMDKKAEPKIPVWQM